MFYTWLISAEPSEYIGFEDVNVYKNLSGKQITPNFFRYFIVFQKS